jgi:hypothetical protein
MIDRIVAVSETARSLVDALLVTEAKEQYAVPAAALHGRGLRTRPTAERVSWGPAAASLLVR